MLPAMGSIIWDREVAEVYDQTCRAMSEPSILDQVTGNLSGLAGGGRALEFAARRRAGGAGCPRPA
jgi:hypothetical protein